MDSSICKERILSENYRDFIVSDILPPPFSGIPPEDLCEQYADFEYRCIYVSSVTADPVNLSRFGYRAIPKCYTPLSMDSLNEAGILPIQNFPTLQLKGNGVMIGFLDTGIDYTNPVFQNIDGSARIMGIWDQTLQDGTSPAGFAFGTEYTEELINEALRAAEPESIVPSKDENGHGTYIASIAAGSGDVQEQFLGAAPEAAIGVVKLKQAKKYLRDYYYIPPKAACFQETDILLGLKYLNNLAERYDMPLVICLAIGTNLGGHTSLNALSHVLEGYSALNSCIPVIGAGNEADLRHHFSDALELPSSGTSVEIRVGENIGGFVMELWSDIPNILSVSLTSPSGETTRPIPIETSATSVYQFIFEKTRVEIAYRLIVQRSTSAMVFFRFSAPASGIWRLAVTSAKTIGGLFHIWLPVQEFLEGEVYFLNANPYFTITDPANTLNTIVVSYYDGSNDGIALSSGRGYTRCNRICPNITAPGINIKGALPGGRFAVRSGSSPAAAITAGAAALLLQWIRFQLGIPRIDSYQIKSLLILGAIRPDGITFPNREWGYGQLNLFNTFDEIRNI